MYRGHLTNVTPLLTMASLSLALDTRNAMKVVLNDTRESHLE